MKNIYASYGAVTALRNINLSIFKGEIHAIVGEHGAGKSTLAKIVSNLQPPVEGSVVYNGKSLYGKSYKKTIESGIRMVYQKMSLNESLTVAENIFLSNLDDFKSFGGLYNRRKVIALADVFLKENAIDLDPTALVSHLELSKRALLSIVRNLYSPPSVLILDESLEKLSSSGLDCVIKFLKKLRDDGAAVLFITHRIDDLYTIADRVSVIRKGEILITENIKDLDKVNLIKMAYTQFSTLEKRNRQVEEFEKLLKYNEVVLTKLPINLIVSSCENHLKLVNESARSFFEIDINGEDILKELIADNPLIEKLISEALSERSIKNYYNSPFVYRMKTYTANIIVYPIIEKNENLGYMLILDDTTEREKLREQLVISDKLASIGLLAAGVAHEINNPLAVISNYLESFREDSFSSEEKENIIEHLFDQVEYMTQIIENLISFSDNRVQSGEILDIGREIKNIIEIINFNGKANSIDINFEKPEKEYFVSLKKSELSQIILNLFRNSFEVLSEGGVINISLSEDFDREGGLVLVFSDNGPGIGLSDPNDVFLPFKSTKQNGVNFGLGLSLCYNILKRNNGEITVVNNSGDGCSFRIRLPLL